MSTLANVNNKGVRGAIGNLCLTSAGLAITTGGSAATFKTGGTITFSIGGRLYTKTTVAAGTIGGTALASGDSCIWAITFDGADAQSYVQGPIFKTTTINGATAYVSKYFGTTAPQSTSDPYPANNTVSDVTGAFLPEVGDDKCVIGYIKIVASAAFTPGTTNLDAANIAATYINAMAPLPRSAAV